MIYILSTDYLWLDAWIKETNLNSITPNEWLERQGAEHVDIVIKGAWRSIIRFSNNEDKLAFMLKYAK